jgi:signal transduction histidine kinase
LLLPAQLSDKSPARFILYVRSLRQETETIDAASPFRISGLLLELIDGTELHRVYRIKSGLVNHLNHQINNDLTTILGAIQMMKIDPASREEMQGAIETQGRSAAATMSRVQTLLAQEINIDYGGSYPVDPRSVIHGVIDRLQPARAEREIGFDLRMQSTPYLVYANPRELDSTLGTCLEFLADDAVQGSKVQIDVTTLADYSTFALRNTGFGIPQDRLDRILAGTAESESGIFEKLRLAMRRIESWGGKVTIRTGLGEGYALTIQLRVF